MKTSVIWTGKSYHSIEHCLIEESAHGNQITSTIIGTFDKKIYKVDYLILTDEHWNTLRVRISAVIDGNVWNVKLNKSGNKWILNGRQHPSMKKAIDVDISLSPFTNTLPIRRVAFKKQQPAVIDVIYFDVLKQQIMPVKQIYTMVSPCYYIYENIDKSFSANIKTDAQGLIKSYPKLFQMTIKVQQDL